MSGRWKICLCATGASLLLALSSASPAAAQNQHDMTFHTVPPCTVVDTRVAGGTFAVGETRTYSVTGSGSFASQGGSTTGCGVPGFSSSIAQVQAVALAVTAISPAGSGYVAANASDETMAGAVLNLATGTTVTNTSPVAVAQTSGVGDFKVFVAYTTTHILVRVVGYYAKPVQLVWVHPVPGDAAASGAALISAVGGILNASATKPYVVKVEPGIYDLGTSALTMKSYVDIEGSGQDSTILQGQGTTDINVGMINGASSSGIRNLQLVSTSSSTRSAIPILIAGGANTRIQNVTITSSGAGSNWGIRVVGSSPTIEDVEIDVTASGGSTVEAYGITTRVSGALDIRRTRINVSNGAFKVYGVYSSLGANVQTIQESHIAVSGTSGTSYGLSQDSQGGLTTVTGSSITAQNNGTAFGVNQASSQLIAANSQISASGGGNNIGVAANAVTIDNSQITGSTYTVSITSTGVIGGSKLNGGAVSGSVTCAGVWDESYVFSASTCP